MDPTDFQSLLMRIAQSAASDHAFLAVIKAAYSEVGKNELERSLRLRLPPGRQEPTLDRSDLVSDFFTVFG